MEFEIWHLWLIASVSLFITEIFVSNFFAVCFGLGALIAGIFSFLEFEIAYQFLAFSLISLTGVLIVNPFLKKYLMSRTYHPLYDSGQVIGKEAFVIEEINTDRRTGKVIISGKTWKAINSADEIIVKGTFVKVIECKESQLKVELV